MRGHRDAGEGIGEASECAGSERVSVPRACVRAPWGSCCGNRSLRNQVRFFPHLKIVAGCCDGVDAECKTAVASAAPERSHLLVRPSVRDLSRQHENGGAVTAEAVFE